jgi:hypothetical protein
MRIGSEFLSVMRTFMRIAGKNIDEDLADRLVVEMCSLGPDAVLRMNHVERAIGTRRAGLHRKVREAINKLEPGAANRRRPTPSS